MMKCHGKGGDTDEGDAAADSLVSMKEENNTVWDFVKRLMCCKQTFLHMIVWMDGD